MWSLSLWQKSVPKVASLTSLNFKLTGIFRQFNLLSYVLFVPLKQIVSFEYKKNAPDIKKEGKKLCCKGNFHFSFLLRFSRELLFFKYEQTIAFSITYICWL
jgi:hypothetical protein